MATETLGAAAGSLITSLKRSANLPAVQCIPVADRSALPVLFDREADRAIPDRVVCWWTGTGEDGEPVLRRPLSADERAAIARRAYALRCATAAYGADHKTILFGAVSAMLGAFPVMQAHDKARARTIAESYMHTVRDEPPWAIIEACDRVRSFRAGLNPNFCPPEPAFASVVAPIAASYRKQLAAAEALLTARIELPEPPRLSREEIEAKLGRPVGDREKPAQAPPAPKDTGYAARVRADLEHRRQRRAAAGEEAAP